MNHFACPHIEDPAVQLRRAEAERRLRVDAFAKVQQDRWSDLTPEQKGWVLAALAAECPDA